MTRIIYDTTGYIISQMQGSDLREPVGVPFLDVEIPEGKYVTGVDVSATPNLPVFANLPKSETQVLQEKLNLMQIALDDLILGGAF